MVDVTDPTAPVERGAVEVDGPEQVQVAGGYAYIAEGGGSNGLRVVDVSDPQRPVRVAQASGEGLLFDIEVTEGRVFAGVYGGSVHVFDYGLQPDSGWFLDEVATCPSESTVAITTTEAGTGTGGVYTIEGMFDVPESPWGSEGLDIQTWTTGPPPEQCCLTTSVVPAKALADGCTAVPAVVEGECGDEVEVTATESAGWVFDHWSGAASGRDRTARAIMSDECSEAVAHFVPFLQLRAGPDNSGWHGVSGCSVIISSVDASDNSGDGIYASELLTIYGAVTASDNRWNGIASRLSVYCDERTSSRVTVARNGDTGVKSQWGSVTVNNAHVTGNVNGGIHALLTAHLAGDRCVVSDNPGSSGIRGGQVSVQTALEASGNGGDGLSGELVTVQGSATTNGNRWKGISGRRAVFGESLEVTGNAEAGIESRRGGVSVGSSAIHDNTGMGVDNLSTTTTVDAAGNWWGDASGPGGQGPGVGDEVSGGVAYDGWLGESIPVVVAPAEGTVTAAAGEQVTTGCFLRRVDSPDDILDVVVTDSRGWVAEPSTFTVELDPETGAASPSSRRWWPGREPG